MTMVDVYLEAIKDAAPANEGRAVLEWCREQLEYEGQYLRTTEQN